MNLEKEVEMAETMGCVRKIYIEFVFSAPFFRNGGFTEPVRSRDTKDVRIPGDALGFKFFDVLEVTVEDDGKPVKLTSARINESPMHYYGGRVYTRAEVAREFPRNQMLLKRMKDSGWDAVIKTRTGDFRGFGKTDIFVEAVV